MSDCNFRVISRMSSTVLFCKFPTGIVSQLYFGGNVFTSSFCQLLALKPHCCNCRFDDSFLCSLSPLKKWPWSPSVSGKSIENIMLTALYLYHLPAMTYIQMCFYNTTLFCLESLLILVLLKKISSSILLIILLMNI